MNWIVIGCFCVGSAIAVINWILGFAVGYHFGRLAGKEEGVQDLEAVQAECAEAINVVYGGERSVKRRRFEPLNPPMASVELDVTDEEFTRLFEPEDCGRGR